MKTDQPILTWLMLTLFVGLKLTGHIDWSWWWVVSPLWIYFLLTVFSGVLIGLIGANRYNKQDT